MSEPEMDGTASTAVVDSLVRGDQVTHSQGATDQDATDQDATNQDAGGHTATQPVAGGHGATRQGAVGHTTGGQTGMQQTADGQPATQQTADGQPATQQTADGQPATQPGAGGQAAQPGAGGQGATRQGAGGQVAGGQVAGGHAGPPQRADGLAGVQQGAGGHGAGMGGQAAALQASLSSDGVLARVRSLLPEFTGALRRVAEQVLTDPAAASRATIVELAERSGTSPATVTRFCRALGFDGYADLRLGIAAETGRARSAGWTVDIGREIQPGDPLERVLGQIMAADTQAMHDTAALLDLAEVERAAVAIAAAQRVNIFGASGSALVGEEMQFSLTRIGVPVWAWADVHNGLASAALSRPGDVALGISHSGETGETIELIAEAGSRGAVTIALTSFPRSPLAELADIVLLTATQATTFRPDALSARHPQLVVLDLLYVAVAQRTHERSHAAFQRTAQAVHGHKAAKDGSTT